MAGIILVLTSLGVPAWLSAILVGAVIGGVSYYLVTSALEKLKHTEIAPNETVESIKEDAQWLKRQVS
jgi:drug/metabolite transporter (DMT)-like permease